MNADRLFPILVPRGVKDCPPSVPWSLVEPHRAQATANHGQTLERLAERGGLSPAELHAVVHDRRWRPMSEVEAVAWLVEMVSIDDPGRTS